MADSCTEGPGNSLKLTGEPGNDLGLQQVEHVALNPLALDASDPGITLDLGLQPSEGNRLHLGGYVEPTQASVRVAATVRRPRASVGIGKHPTLWLAARTKAPAAAVGFVQVLRGTVAARTPRPTAAVQVGDCKPLRISARTRRPTVSLAIERIVLSNLLNLQPADPGNPLELGAEEGGNDLHLGGFTPIVRGEVHAAISARTRRPTARITTVKPTPVAIAARTPRAACWIGTGYDPNLLSDIVADAHEDWRQGAILGADARVRTVDGIRLVAGGVDQGRHGRAVDGPIAPAWSAAPGAQGIGGCGWTPGDRQAGTTPVSWRGAPSATQGSRNSYRDGTPASRGVPDEWMRGLPHLAPSPPTEGPNTKPPRGGFVAQAWRDAETASRSHRDGFRDGQRIAKPCDRNVWNEGDLVAYVRRVPTPWSPPVKPLEPEGNALHLCRLDNGNDLQLGQPCVRRIPRRRSYSVQHQIRIIRLSDGTPVPASQVNLSLDADSWAWVWNVTLIGAEALALVLPSALGEPVTLEATIDGNTWHLVVEDWQEDRQFAACALRISGRGISCWLGSPYQPTTSGTLENARTLAQAMMEQLPLEAGWTIHWAPGTPDWLMPSGSWNWVGKAPIQAIHEAAQAVGLVVVPSRTTKELTIQPRYPVLPWRYRDATPDLSVPDSAIVSVSRRQAVPTQANAVYVHGGPSGIIARVWRTQTAGDRLAATVSADPITHADGARLLGERVLAAQEQQPAVRSFTLPLGGVFFLAQLGDLVSLDIGGEDVRGIVNGVSITAQGNSVHQTVTIGEDTPNAWALWRRLLPEAPLLLGEVQAIHADGTRTVALIGGGRQRVRGDGAVGTAVWIRSGQIEGSAPDLPRSDVEVF